MPNQSSPPVPDTSGQNQRLSLPIITNVSALAGAALGRPVGALLVVALAVVGVLLYRVRRGNKG